MSYSEGLSKSGDRRVAVLAFKANGLGSPANAPNSEPA
jgi:hypothetical protein